MNATTAHPPMTSVPRDDHDVRLAWSCLLAAPIAFVAAFAAGSGIATALDVEEGGVAPPGVAALVLVVSLVLFAVPTGFAWRFANRAHGRGDDRGRVPAIVLTALVGAFLAQNVLSWVAGLVLD
jgi:hypothetical protein